MTRGAVIARAQHSRVSGSVMTNTCKFELSAFDGLLALVPGGSFATVV